MWQKISIFIIKYRLALLIFLGLSTVFMAYHATKIEFKYGFVSIMPPDDPRFIDYEAFKAEFGEDGNAVALSVMSPDIFEKYLINGWFELGNQILELQGVEEVLSYTHLYDVKRDREKRAFVTKPILEKPIETEEERENFIADIERLKFYDEFIINREEQAVLMIILFDEEAMLTDLGLENVEKINAFTAAFSQSTGIEVYSTGFTFIRSYKMEAISTELKNLLFYATVLIFIVLMLLFRSFYPVIFPIVVIFIGVIWSMGSLALFNYELTILTGLIPNLILVIGIPNCVYILNKYHIEFKKHGQKIRALTRVIEKIGYITFFANLTTAIGFGVFAFTQSGILQEFGIVAGLMISATFLISLISIPVIFSYLPKPKEKQIFHLDNKWITSLLLFFDRITLSKKPVIFLSTFLILIAAFFGIARLESKGFLLDDVPEESKVYQDLKFVEAHFNGVMPFEIIVDTRRKGAANQLVHLRRIDALQDSLARFEALSKPLSIVNGLKFATQAYFGGNPSHYRLPRDNVMQPEISFILNYLNNSEAEDELLKNFVDTAGQKIRISYRIADIGSHKMPGMLDSIQPVIDHFLSPEDYDVTLTGTTVAAFAGFNYLINGLINSLLIALVLISFIMTYLFRSMKMMVISLIPNILPLIVTAALMGFFDIPIKPSTAIIFSIAFGISVDYSIHFLAKYKQELNRHAWDIQRIVSNTIKETGISMVYTSLILFFGFFTFTLSAFEGTWFLGILTSITLVGALLSNLILLPALLLTFEKKKN